MFDAVLPDAMDGAESDEALPEGEAVNLMYFIRFVIFNVF